jgi:hypothetical protein
MARADSKIIMGYLPLEERHYLAVLSLVQPATPTHAVHRRLRSALLHMTLRNWACQKRPTLETGPGGEG